MKAWSALEGLRPPQTGGLAPGGACELLAAPTTSLGKGGRGAVRSRCRSEGGSPAGLAVAGVSLEMALVC